MHKHVFYVVHYPLVATSTGTVIWYIYINEILTESYPPKELQGAAPPTLLDVEPRNHYTHHLSLLGRDSWAFSALFSQITLYPDIHCQPAFHMTFDLNVMPKIPCHTHDCVTSDLSASINPSQMQCCDIWSAHPPAFHPWVQKWSTPSRFALFLLLRFSAI